MIIDFNVGNFRSIKDIQTLSLNAGNLVSKYKILDENNVINLTQDLKLLKSKAIYGANASGKSTIIRAFVAFIAIVNRSVKDEEILQGTIEPNILFSDTEESPTFFQLSFILEGVHYRYGFEATANEIVSEWLFGSPALKEINFFTREGTEIKVNTKYFKEASKLKSLYGDPNNEIARSNSLFLTTVKSLNGDLSKKIVDYISDITVVTGLGDPRMHRVAANRLKNEISRKRINDMLKIADIGINDIHNIEISKENLPDDAPSELIELINEGKKHFMVITEHVKYDLNLLEHGLVPFDMRTNESEGSKKMFEISYFILEALDTGRTLIIDEFDARFHPALTKKLVMLFNSIENTKTQFIFVTHDTNLLSSKFLRRDQIAFVEKDKYGRSKVYSLADFKGIRNDASFEKDYMNGKYGGIPFLGDFEKII
jgi:uncharacterized protein